jgi:hypothetical protein
MGIFNFFKRNKQKDFQQQFNQVMNEYKNFVEENKSKTLDENTSEKYYDDIFDEVMLSSGFFYPHKSQNIDDIEFMVIPPDTQFANENSQRGQIGLFVYLWLRNVSKQNIVFHNHLLSLFIESPQLSIEEHLNYIQSIIKNDSLTQIIRDTKILQAISIRIRAYCVIIERLTNSLLKFYVEHEDDCVRCLLQIDKEYSPTERIENVSGLSIQNIEYIFIRDMLSGKDLTKEKNDGSQIVAHNCSPEYSDNKLDNALFVEMNKPMLNRETIRLLVSQGANINAYDRKGYDVFQNLLFSQTFRDSDEEDFEINLDDIQFVLDLGIDVNNPIKSKGQEGYNCLFIAVHSEGNVKKHTTTFALIEMLLKAGADPNMQHYDDESILDATISRGGHYDHKQKEWIDDGSMDDVIELLEKYGAKTDENTLTDIQIQKIRKCIDIANEYLTEEGYEPKDYSLNECYDLISLWEEKGLSPFFHWSGPTGGGCSGFREQIRIECIAEWYRVLTNQEISIDILQHYIGKLSGGMYEEQISTKLLDNFNFSLSEISKEKEQPLIKIDNSKPSLFTDENGEPSILKHDCPIDRIGKEMTKEEMHHFAVELLSNLYKKAGMTMVNVNRHYDRKFPSLVMKSKNGKLYYVIIETASYPQKAEYSCDFPEMKEYAKKHNATPTFAGVSFMNASRELENLLCGDKYFVDFKGLKTI